MAGKIIIFGIGYVGRAFADALLAENWTVVGTCRSLSKKEQLKKIGIHAEIFDGETPFSNWEEFSKDATHVLACIPPSDNMDPVYRHYSHHIATLNPTWVGYLSTTGVYGDHAGGWVDEDSPTRASTDRAIARLVVENTWLGLDTPAHIFRLAGIYGTGRNAIDNLYQGTTRNIVKNNHYFSRIHVTDIVQTLMASMNAPRPGRIYNVADDEPSPGSDVIEFAAQLIGLEAPPRIEAATATMSEMGKEFYDNNKRVKNTRLKTELGIQLRYPTYREGLRAILARRLAAKIL